MKRLSLLFILLFLSACAAQPVQEPTPTASLPFTLKSADNPYASKPEDANLQIGGAEITSINLAEKVDLTPTRVEVRITGSLPRACNQLRIDIAAPNDQYQILMEVYSLVDLKVECENVFQQFEAAVLLGVYSPGRYTVWVNGGLIGDFVTY